MGIPKSGEKEVTPNQTKNKGLSNGQSLQFFMQRCYYKSDNPSGRQWLDTGSKKCRIKRAGKDYHLQAALLVLITCISQNLMSFLVRRELFLRDIHLKKSLSNEIALFRN